MAKVKEETERAQILEALSNSNFRIKYVSDGETGIAYLGGKMRVRRVRILVGDMVDVVVDPYGGKSRIVNRIIKRQNNN
jgi:translation initiation factor IF-1